MIEINLLPKELQKRRFGPTLDKNIVYALAGGLGVTFVLILITFFFLIAKYNNLQKQLEEAKAEAAKHASEIAKIDEITAKKNQILARMSAIEVLDRNRDYWVNLMEDLALRVPEYLWLTSVEQSSSAESAAPPQASRISVGSSIEGFSYSLNSVATFMVRLKKSKIFENIQMSSVKLQEADKIKAYSFRLTCNLADLTDSVRAEAAEQASKPAGQF
jgi:Tfp pilus assembly protein PilN